MPGQTLMLGFQLCDGFLGLLHCRAVNNRNAFSHRSGDQKAEVKVGSGWVPFGASEGEPVPCVSRFTVVASTLGAPGLWPHPSSLCLHLPAAFTCVRALPPSHKDTRCTGHPTPV